jgi:hypothetical protein
MSTRKRGGSSNYVNCVASSHPSIRRNQRREKRGLQQLLLRPTLLPSSCQGRWMTRLQSTASSSPASEDIAEQEPRDSSIIDTCDEVRRKINAHMKKPGVVQAQFLRDIAASYRKAPRKVQSTQLSKFRSKKGAWEGNTSVVFYGAYVFFEKMRIAEKKPKSKKRLEMAWRCGWPFVSIFFSHQG